MEVRRLRIVCGLESAHVRLEGSEAVVDDRRHALRIHAQEREIESVELDGRIFPVRVVRDGERVLVWCAGRVFDLRRDTGRAGRSRDVGGDLVAPMPGRVRQVFVGVGATVATGDVLLVLEAMKMEHSIRAPRDGVIRSIAHGEGELVEAGVKLAEIE